MKFRMGIVALAVLAVAGCGSATHHPQAAVSAPACPSGEPRIQTTAGGPWVCDPDGPESPAATVAAPAPATTPDASFTCDVTRTGTASGGYPYAAYTMTISTVNGVGVKYAEVVFYDSTGAEMGSDAVQIFEEITPGQTLTEQEGYESASGQAAAATCDVVSWS